MSPMKNQYSCGSCAAFAVIAVVESCFKEITGKFVKYSEQELLDCSETGGSCKGGNPQNYLHWLAKKHTAVAREQDYPYDSKNWENDKRKYACRDSTKLKSDKKSSKRPRIKKESVIFDNYGTEEDLKVLVYKRHVVAASIFFTNATRDRLITYNGAYVFNCTEEDATSYDNGHAVAVVGYGNSKANEEGEDFWLIKNSWGLGWGYQGFLYLQRGNLACGIGTQYAVVDCCDLAAGDC